MKMNRYLKILMTWVVFALASPASAIVFIDMGATSQGGDTRITASGAHAATRVTDGCLIRRMSDGALTTRSDIPDADVDCADVNDSGQPVGYELLANATGVCYGTPTANGNDCAYRSITIVGDPAWGMAHDYFGSAFQRSEAPGTTSPVYAGRGRALGAALTDPLTPSVTGPALTTKFPKRLSESAAQAGEFRGVSPSGTWAAGFMHDPALFVDRPFFFQVSDATGFPMLTFDAGGYGAARAIADAPGGSFIAVGEADRTQTAGEVTFTRRDGIRWNGIEDSPDWLMPADDANTTCVTRVTSINRDGTYVGGSSCGEAVVWGPGEIAVPSSFMRFIAASNVVPAGWVLTETTDVALDDDVFVGKGTLNGVPRNWAIDMEGTPVPEPPMTMLMGAGVVGLVAVQKRRSVAVILAGLLVLASSTAEAQEFEPDDVIAYEAMEAGKACLEDAALTDEEREECVRVAMESARADLAAVAGEER